MTNNKFQAMSPEYIKLRRREREREARRERDRRRKEAAVGNLSEELSNALRALTVKALTDVNADPRIVVVAEIPFLHNPKTNGWHRIDDAEYSRHIRNVHDEEVRIFINERIAQRTREHNDSMKEFEDKHEELLKRFNKSSGTKAQAEIRQQMSDNGKAKASEEREFARFQEDVKEREHISLTKASHIKEIKAEMRDYAVLKSDSRDWEQKQMSTGTLLRAHNVDTREPLSGRGFANGHFSINFTTGKTSFVSRADNWFDPNVLQYDYDENGIPEHFLELAGVVVQGDTKLVDRICESFGCFFYGQNALHKWIVFYGDGGTGKGLLLDVLIGLYNSSSDLYSPHSLAAMGGPFGMEGSISKEGVVMQEVGRRPTGGFILDNYNEGMEQAKKHMAGGTTWISRKGKTDVEVICDMPFISATNHRDILTATTPQERSALERRMVPTEFKKTGKGIVAELAEVFTDGDENMATNKLAQYILKKDTEATIASYCLRKFAEAVKRGRELDDAQEVLFSTTGATEALLREVADLSKTEEEEFVEDYIAELSEEEMSDAETYEDSFTANDDVFNAFKEVYDHRRVNKYMKVNLLREIRELKGVKSNPDAEKRKVVNGERKKGFYGIKLTAVTKKKDADINVTETTPEQEAELLRRHN